MLSAISPAGGAGGGPPPMPMLGSATGAPPPSGIGAIPTGAGAVPSKVALGTAIQNLREVKSQFPDSSGDVDKWIATLQSLANPAKPVPASAPPAPDAGAPDAGGGDAPT
jgi:hypothetical protein